MFDRTKKNNLSTLSIIIFLWILGSFASADPARPKYIFFMIGDGMGTIQRMATECYYHSKQLNQGIPESEIKKLTMNEMPVFGLTTTFSVDAVVTDSSAAGTALATGYKTFSDVISMDSQKKEKLKTVAEHAKQCGLKVGIISNAWINHATPAVFYSHQPDRYMYYEIAVDLANSNFDYFGGGFAKGIEESELKGRENPLDIAQKNGFIIADSFEKVSALRPCGKKVWAYDKTQKVYNKGTLNYAIDRPEDRIELSDFVANGIKMLDGPEGFFFMIEGGEIDWLCHANDAASTIKDTIAFDKAIKIVMDFYKKHKNETLVIVTADHETGGMKLDYNSTNLKYFSKIIDAQKGSEIQFAPIVEKCKTEKIEFEQALKIMGSFFGISDLTSNEKEAIKQAYFQGGRKSDGFGYGENRTIMIAWTKILGARIGITWQCHDHTDRPVATTAIGVGSENFRGLYDNTDIAKILFSLISSETIETSKCILPRPNSKKTVLQTSN